MARLGDLEEPGDDATVVMDAPDPAKLEAMALAARQAPAPGPAEWFVGIDNQPVGPVDKRYLKAQIDAGKVSADSLVWREDLTDWKPLNTFPELRELLATKGSPVGAPLAAPEDAASVPMALTRAIPTSDAAPAVSSPAASVSSPSAPSPTAPDRPAPAAEVAKPAEPAAALVAELGPSPRPAVAAAPSMAEEPEPESTAIPVGLAGLAPPPSEISPPVEPAPKPVEPAPRAEPSAKPPASEIPASEDLLAAGIPPQRRKALHPMAYAFIAMAAAFGAVAAWFLFGQTTSGPVAENPTAVTSAPAGGPSYGLGEAPPPPPPDPNASAATTAEASGTTRPSAGGTGTSPSGKGSEVTGSGAAPPEDDGGSTTPQPTPKPCDPDSPFCNSGPDGPSAKPNTGNGSDSATGLSPEQANATVARYKGSLMRTCRNLVTKGSAKVAATITVSPSGAVSSASVSGGGNVPGLASCVKSRIMNWRFPSAGASSTISVSFNFL
ncbi:MAG: GYF domain-containing protein [Polyangiaceae bacterium]